MAGEERVITWIGNGADVLMERALTWARQERATLRAAMGKPSVDDHDIPQDEQLRILRKLFDRYYAEAAEEGSFLFPAVADTLGALHAKGLPLALVTNKPTPFVAPLLDALDIAKYFTVVIGGDDVQNKKPHPERCCWWRKSSLWLQPSCCLSAIRAMIFRRPKRQAAALLV
ncbi:phosphoglycolate phosphatase [Klebsiella pneumoniae subsp. ozaenae]|uniref:phosphoglycolate phosphatase n=1 Tax=Klebsiella pneumoniae subsp. ozaenae TaxID=574 RepID=A0A377YXD0_KLEPO|nr:phosphoglycolate phosphatase [Klebsiella pneumoniae subsp. ozaenae]